MRPGSLWNASAFGMEQPTLLGALARCPERSCAPSRVRPPPQARALRRSLMPAREVISTTRNSPRVSVPVLSKNTALRLRASSRPRRSRTSKPFLAPSVVEMATTSGMASPSACGHAITRTVTTRSITNAACAPAMDHPTSVQGRGDDRHNRESEGRSVGERLRARTRVLRLRDEPHDAGERRLFSGAGDLDAQRARAVDRSRDHVGIPTLAPRVAIRR